MVSAATKTKRTATDMAKDPHDNPEYNPLLPKASYLTNIFIILFTLSISLCILLGLYILQKPYLWPPFIAYIAWYVLIDTKSVLRGECYRGEVVRRSVFWKIVASYFPAKLVNDTGEESLSRSKNYIFVQHPHGFYCYGAFFNFSSNATGFRETFPGIFVRLTTLAFNFYIPFWREVQASYGTMSVDYHSCKHFLSKAINPLWNSVPVGKEPKQSKASSPKALRPISSSASLSEMESEVESSNLNADSDYNNTTSSSTQNAGLKSDERTQKRKGKALMIVVGGAEEVRLMDPGTMDLVLNKRKGFVKLALETGSSLVPVITFGENDIYTQVANVHGSRMRKFQDMLIRRFGFTLPLAYGRLLWLLPFKRPLVSVVGKPIDIPKVEKPGRELVNQYHSEYIQTLNALYDRWKNVYAKDRKRDLRIVA